MDKPVNTLNFTITMLVNLRNALEDKAIDDLNFFCDYDKQALEDAVIYLNWLRG